MVATTINVLYWVSLSPAIIAFSPFFLLISSLQLTQDCNQMLPAEILQVNNVDMLKCEVQLYIPHINHYAAVNIACHEIVNSMTNVSVILNKTYKEASCLKMVNSNEDKYITDYATSLTLFYISLVGFIPILVLIISGVTLRQVNCVTLFSQHKIDVFMYSLDRRKLATHIYSLFPSLRKVARILNVSHTTVARWLKHPERKSYCKEMCLKVYLL